MEEITIHDPEAFRAAVEAALQNDDQTRGATLNESIQTFCQKWSTAREVLTLFQSIAPAIPGAGWIVVKFIPVVISAGNAAAAALCYATAGREDVTP